MKKEIKQELSHAEKIVEFLKSLPQVKSGNFTKPFVGITIDVSKGGAVITYDMFGKYWTEITYDKTTTEDFEINYLLMGSDNIDLKGNLEKIWYIIQANEEDIRNTFKVDDSAKIESLKQQIATLEKELNQYENGADNNSKIK